MYEFTDKKSISACPHPSWCPCAAAWWWAATPAPLLLHHCGAGSSQQQQAQLHSGGAVAGGCRPAEESIYDDSDVVVMNGGTAILQTQGRPRGNRGPGATSVRRTGWGGGKARTIDM